MADRVTFEVRDVTDDSLTGTYDAAFAFEMIYDLARPVDALRAMRRLTAMAGPASWSTSESGLKFGRRPRQRG